MKQGLLVFIPVEGGAASAAYIARVDECGSRLLAVFNFGSMLDSCTFTTAFYHTEHDAAWVEVMSKRCALGL